MKFGRMRRPLAIAALSTAALLGTGCAYFNTFHYAKKHYAEAERQRVKAPDAKPSNQILELYEKSMKKCAKILTDYAGSRWVDDALLLMGKCARARGEHSLAIRKFEELIAFYPQSGKIPEARYETGVAYLEEGDPAAAAAALTAVLDDPNAKDFREEARFQFGRSALALGDSAGSLAAFEQFLEANSRHPLSRRAGEAVAAIYLARNEPALARAAYEKVETDPRRDWAGHKAVRLSIARSLTLEGRPQEARREYSDLLSLAKETADSAEISVEAALVARSEGADSLAIELLDEIPVRFPRTKGAARALHERGVLVFDRTGDIRRAKASFDSVGVHSTEIPEQKIAKSRADLISQRIGLDERLVGRLQRIQASALAPGLAPESAPAAHDSSGTQAVAGSADSAASADSADSAGARPATPNLPRARSTPPDPAAAGTGHRDSTAAGVADRDSVAAETATADSGAAPALDNVAFLAALGDTGLHTLITLADSAGRAEIAQTLVEIGQVELLHLSRVPQALSAYETVAREFPDSPLLPKALLAIAWIRRNRMGDPEEAARLHWKILEEFGETEYARGAAEALGMEFAEPPPAPIDTAAVLAAYAVRDSVERVARERKVAEAVAREKAALAAATDSARAAASARAEALEPVPGFERDEVPGRPGPAVVPGPPNADGESLEPTPMDLLPPRALLLATPNYPPDLAERGVQGAVTVQVTVSPSGSVTHAEVIRSDNPELDGFAVEASLRSVFTPPREVNTTTVTFEFPPLEP